MTSSAAAFAAVAKTAWTRTSRSGGSCLGRFSSAAAVVAPPRSPSAPGGDRGLRQHRSVNSASSPAGVTQQSVLLFGSRPWTSVRQLHQSARRNLSSAAQPSSSESADDEENNGGGGNGKPKTASVSSPKRFSLSVEDEHVEENKRRRLRDVLVSEVLKAKHSYRWVDPVIPRSATVRDAILTTIEGGLSGMMVLADDDADGRSNRVVGLLTSRDLLRIIASGVKDGDSSDTILMGRNVGDYMTPISQVIYARPGKFRCLQP